MSLDTLNDFLCCLVAQRRAELGDLDAQMIVSLGIEVRSGQAVLDPFAGASRLAGNSRWSVTGIQGLVAHSRDQAGNRLNQLGPHADSYCWN